MAVSAAEIQKYIKGISFPVSKADLLNKAKANGAPEDVCKWIEQLPSGEFGGPQDVMKGFGEIA